MDLGGGQDSLVNEKRLEFVVLRGLASSARVRDNRESLRCVTRALGMLGVDDFLDATSFQLAMRSRLEEVGFDVTLEYPIPLSKDRDGYIDLVARGRNGMNLAVELDYASPREKSVRKLAKMDALKLIVLRQNPRTFRMQARVQDALRQVDAVIYPCRVMTSRREGRFS